MRSEAANQIILGLVSHVVQGWLPFAESVLLGSVAAGVAMSVCIGA